MNHLTEIWKKTNQEIVKKLMKLGISMLLLQGAQRKPTLLPPGTFLEESKVLVKKSIVKNYIESTSF